MCRGRRIVSSSGWRMIASSSAGMRRRSPTRSSLTSSSFDGRSPPPSAKTPPTLHMHFRTNLASGAGHSHTPAAACTIEKRSRSYTSMTFTSPTEGFPAAGGFLSCGAGGGTAGPPTAAPPPPPPSVPVPPPPLSSPDTVPRCAARSMSPSISQHSCSSPPLFMQRYRASSHDMSSSSASMTSSA